MKQTPSQTVGPYFAYGLTPEQYLFDFKSLAKNDLSLGSEDYIQIRGQVFDGEKNTINDAMIEVWDQQNQAFGRFGTGTEADHSFVFKVQKPKETNGSAPFLSVIVFMRGQLVHSYTRIYFEAEPANAEDAVFDSISENRRHTLIAKKAGNNYRFDIHMQGENETVFFDI
jgi:protocatechuate 3,4-dioxygenase, alpha subunit